MSKRTNFVIWNNVNSFHYAGTKNLLILDQDTNFKLVLNTLFSASGYRIAIKNL